MKPDDKIWSSPPFIGETEMEYVRRALESNWITPSGPFVDAFEAALRDFARTKAVLAVQSGAAALHLALRVLNVEAGDLVLAPTFTYVATASPIAYLGASPVFIDACPDDYALDPDVTETALKSLLSNGRSSGKPRVKALIVAHLYGDAADIAPFRYLSDKYGVPLVEDAAEAMGSATGDRPTGTTGDLGFYSFNGNKIITTSGGGALFSDNEAYIARARALSRHGRKTEAPLPLNDAIDPYADPYDCVEIGYTYGLSNICAALGLAQMERLPDKLTRRKAIFQYYQAKLKDLPDVSFPILKNGVQPSYWLTTVHFNDEKRAQAVRQALTQQNIDARPFWKPLHLQKPFEGALYFGERNAERWRACGLCLPSGDLLAPAQLDKVCEIIRSV